MTEERDAAVSRSEPEPPEPERYYAERISSTAEGLSLAALQEAINEGARKSWRLVGVMNDPADRGVILVWDQQGFISG